MTDRSIETSELPWYRGPAFILLVVLLSVYAVGTFIGHDGLGIVVVGIVGQVLIQRLAERPAYLWNSVASLVFFSAVLVFLVWALFKAKRVDADTVFAASAVFLLLGIVCAFAFMLV